MTTEPLPYGDFTGCEWPVDEECLENWDSYSISIQDRALALATNTLRRLTGYRVGGCPITVRPCRSRCVTAAFLPYYARHFSPWINTAGMWVNSCGCNPRADCSCADLCEVVLPAPVGAVYEVKIDGVVVPTTDYRVDGNRLVWTGAGECGFPLCQDLSQADTQADTFSVRYLNSYPVDGLGAVAAGMLANEYAKACSGGQCRLPSNVTAITRQGVTMEIEGGAFPSGFTGIREVDAYIALWNPEGRRQASTVWYPGMNRPRVTG